MAEEPMVLEGLALLGAPIVLGVLLGYARDGRLRQIASINWGPLWLLWLAAAIQAGQYYAPAVRQFVEGQIRVPMLVLVYFCVFVWLGSAATHWVGAMKWAAIILILGGVLNGIVIALNGRMPYSTSAAIQLGGDPSDAGPKNVPQSPDTVLAGLGDVFPVPFLRQIVSPGDVLIAAGSVALVAGAMAASTRNQHPGHRRHGRTSRSTELKREVDGRRY